MTALIRPASFRPLSLTSGPRSLNGWPGLPNFSDPRMTTRTVPGTSKSIHLRKEVMPVFLNLLARINKEVLPLNPGPLDSYEYRPARQGGGLSNHSSGTAIDFRYDVLKADNLTHMTPTQRAKMERILDAYKTPDGHRLFGWGGEWRNGVSRDEMHIEVGQDWQVGRAITPADFTRFTASHHLKPDGTVGAVSPTPPPTTPQPTHATVHLHLLRPGLTNAEVKTLQAALKRHGFDPGPLDGQFGPKTQVAVQRLQRSLGFTGHDADGVPGRTSLRSLGFTVAA
ncbi:MAG: peptidoglycan-binding protein [Myxococcaceae bacterium]